LTSLIAHPNYLIILSRIAGVLEDAELVGMSTISLLSRINDTPSTEWGPGTIFGRVLLGIGEAVKDGFDKILIRQRLNILNSTFSHEPLPSTSLSQLYDDVLELSQCMRIVQIPNLYFAGYESMSADLASIVTSWATSIEHPSGPDDSRQNPYLLLLSLGRWPVVEIQLFLAQIIACMPHPWSVAP